MESIFKNKNMNLLDLHAGFHRFSINIVDVFGAVYLLGFGIPFPIVALVGAASCVVRMMLRPLSLWSTEKIGLKKALVIGTMVNAGIFLALAMVNGINAWLYFYILYSAICDITYWLPYHSYNAAIGDLDKRGEEQGVQLGLVTVARMVAPIIGGFMIVRAGFLPLYLGAMMIMILGAVPLLFAHDAKPGKKIPWREAFRSIDKRGLIIQIGDGILYMQSFVWSIVLFMIVGNYALFGGLVAFEMFASAILALVLGYFIDKGKGRRIMTTGLIILGIVIVLRAFFVRTIPWIIAIDILLAFGMTFYADSFDTAFYTMAKKSGNPLWFHFFGELGWDIGAILSLGASALLVTLGVPLAYVILFSIPGLFIINRILRRFYKPRVSIPDSK